MLVWALVSWWYTGGWAHVARRALDRLRATLDFFSIWLLLKSLFAPYRQLSAGSVSGAVGVQLRAWADRQISRGIGAIIRLFVIVFGLIATVLTLIVVIISLLIWPLVPVMPLIAIVVAIVGVGK